MTICFRKGAADMEHEERDLTGSSWLGSWAAAAGRSGGQRQEKQLGDVASGSSFGRWSPAAAPWAGDRSLCLPAAIPLVRRWCSWRRYCFHTPCEATNPLLYLLQLWQPPSGSKLHRCQPDSSSIPRRLRFPLPPSHPLS
jgi:hypothetical protein